MKLWEETEKESHKIIKKKSVEAGIGAAAILKSCAVAGYKVGARVAAEAATEGGEALFRGLGVASKVAHIGGFAFSAVMLPVAFTR